MSERQPHVPDRSLLLTGPLNWEPVTDDTMFEDYDQLLVAVPICNDYFPRGWHYKYDVVTVRCDEHYFNLEGHNGASWGLDISDVDFFVRLK